ncbi:unnamed protein product [Schistosoma rodhaini]|nr:unnamed protein product [Schistosoma rodhaini]
MKSIGNKVNDFFEENSKCRKINVITTINSFRPLSYVLQNTRLFVMVCWHTKCIVKEKSRKLNHFIQFSKLFIDGYNTSEDCNNQKLDYFSSTNMHSSSCRNKLMPNYKELFPYTIENDTTSMDNSVDVTVRQKPQITERSLTNSVPNSNNYTRDDAKFSYFLNQYDHALYYHLKNNNVQPNHFDILRSFSSPLSSSSTSVTTTQPPITSSSLLLLWLSRLNELIYENSQEVTETNCIYKTLTNLLSETSTSQFSNDSHKAVTNNLNNYLDSANIQNQTKRVSYLYNKIYSDQDQTRNGSLIPGITLTNQSKIHGPPNVTFSKLWDDNKSSSCDIQVNDVYSKNCKTNRDRHQGELNYLPSSLIPSTVFPYFNFLMDSRMMRENSKELNCNPDKKFSVQLDKMCTVDRILHNAASKWDNLLNNKSITHLSDSPIPFNADKPINLINSGNTDQWKLNNECHLNKCVRLINGEIKVREDLSVSDFISSAIKYDNFNKSTYDNGSLIEALASTNNLEMCWVKLIQIKNDSNNNTVNLSSELTFIQSSKRHHLLVGKNEKNCSKQASRMLWPHFNAKSFNVDKKLVLNVTNDYPFFVYGHGWSSIEPNLTLNQQDLSCRQLKTDDICLVLTYCVLSAGRKSRISTTNSCTYKMALSNENYSVNYKSQSTPKSVPLLNYDAKNNCSPLTGSERNFNNELNPEFIDYQKIPINLKMDPYNNLSSYCIEKNTKLKQYDSNIPVMKKSKLELSHKKTIKSNTIISHPFSAYNLAKSPENL